MLLTAQVCNRKTWGQIRRADSEKNGNPSFKAPSAFLQDFPPTPHLKRLIVLKSGLLSCFLLLTLSGKVCVAGKLPEEGGGEKRRGLQTSPPGVGSICPVRRWQGECRHPHSLPQASLSVLGRAVWNQDLCSGPNFHRSTHPYEHEC